MRWPTYYARLLAAIIASSVASTTFAEDGAGKLPGPRFSAELGVGAEHDDNVAVEEVDLSSSASDYALIVDAKLGLKQQLSQNTGLSLSYDFSQSFYQEFSEIDRQTHIVGADLSSKFSKFNGGISFFYINSRLDGKAFLELYRASPSISGFLSKKWFARGAYVYSEKSIENRPGRDTDAHSGEADIYYFHRGLRSYFNLGFRYKEEDAKAQRYDYQSQTAKLRYVRRIELLSRTAKLELAWRYEDRDYSSVTPSIGTEREDQRQRWKVGLEVPLWTNAAVQFDYGFNDYSSNYPQAEYDQNLMSIRFYHRW